MSNGLNDLKSSPIFISTIFKSGTKLLECIVERLTGLSINTPSMIHDYSTENLFDDHESAKRITFEEGKFFIWHNVINEEVRALLNAANAKPILLIRNIYDLLISQYYHFSEDVDKSIGHSTKTIDYFSTMSREQGISFILCGGTSKQFHWHGFGFYLYQMQEALKFSKEYPCHIVNYDRLVSNKPHEIERLANFLDIKVTSEQISEIVDISSLSNMRKARTLKSGSGKHFRKGKPGSHVEVLKPYQYDMVSYLKLSFAPELDALCEELQYGDVVSATPPIKKID